METFTRQVLDKIQTEKPTTYELYLEEFLREGYYISWAQVKARNAVKELAKRQSVGG
jgi:hypothetical protein